MFSSSTVLGTAIDKEEGKDESQKPLSNAFKNQHIKYVPKKRLSFHLGTPDGPMALIFQADDALLKQAITWKVALASAIPAACIAFYTVPGMYLPYVYPMVFSPALYGCYAAQRLRKTYKTEVYKMYLLKNGA